MFDNVVLNKVGLGSKNEKLLLNKYEESSISSFFKIEETSFAVKICSHKKINESVVDKRAKIEECDVITLDSYCHDNHIDRINLLKIDTQGFENEVLGGAKALLENGKVGVILTEITFDDVYGSGNSFFQLESFVVPFDYKLYDIAHIYKDLNIGRTCWVDAVYVRTDYLNELLDRMVK
jgi:FkbM family methyltransferase